MQLGELGGVKSRKQALRDVGQMKERSQLQITDLFLIDGNKEGNCSIYVTNRSAENEHLRCHRGTTAVVIVAILWINHHFVRGAQLHFSDDFDIKGFHRKTSLQRLRTNNFECINAGETVKTLETDRLDGHADFIQHENIEFVKDRDRIDGQRQISITVQKVRSHEDVDSQVLASIFIPNKIAESSVDLSDTCIDSISNDALGLGKIK
mmetsp:Transcript_13460/g.22374  ORF Transcript_13460/g.22374 Transcript_13460/m.22374 type:complete len:208 (+) Transcript_13460:507-1130(+)